MRTPNPHLYIPVEFRDEDLIVHVASSWAMLIDKVREYRERNSKPAGDPEKEIFAQVCDRNPSQCRDTTKDSVLPTDDLHKRILRWVSDRVEERAKLKFVGESEARERAAICSACVRLRPWRNACGACAKTADKLVREVLGDRVIFSQSRGCASLREDPRLSVWLNKPRVRGNLPGNCWRKE